MRRARWIFFSLLSMCVGSSQTISFGLKAGVPFGDATILSGPEQLLDTHRWMLGPTIELRLAKPLSLGFDALYRSYDFWEANVAVSSHFEATRWELPLYLKYRIPAGRIQPFLSGGVASARTGTRVTWSACASYLPAGFCGPNVPGSADGPSGWRGGAVLSAGAEFNTARLKLAPELRYLRWSNGVLLGENTGSVKRDQFDFLFGVRF